MRPRAATLTLALGLLLAACGSGGDTDPAAATDEVATTAAPSPTPDPTSVPPSSVPAEPDPEPTTPPPAPPPSPPAPDAPAEAAVTIADFDYAPDPVEVAAGGTVTWTNQDSTAHTATVSGGPNTGAISGGSSASLTFDTPGTYDYLCQFHPGSMTGTVVVR